MTPARKRWLASRQSDERKREFVAGAVWDLLLFAALACVIFAAQTTRARGATPLDASVIIRGETGRDAFTGSGTAIDSRNGHTLVITCGHLFRGYPGRQVTVSFHDGRTVAGTVLSYTFEPDIALVSADGEAAAVAKIAASTPQISNPTIAVGMFGVKAGVVRSLNRYLGHPNLCVSGVAVQGDSGGGVFNGAGELVGVINSADPPCGETIAASLPVVLGAVASVNIHETGCRWVRDPCGNWVKICDQRPPSWTPPQQPAETPAVFQPPQLPPVAEKPAQPTQPTPNVSVQVNKHESQLTAINQQITNLQQQVGQAKSCDCGPKWTDIETRLNDLKTQIAASQSATATCVTFAEKQQAAIAELKKQLDHDTPVRVYLPDGKLAGDGKVNIFRGESIDFTFNPRALLDSTAGER